MSINIFTEDVDKPEIDEKKLHNWIEDIVLTESKNVGALNIIFCSDDYLIKINKEYLNHNDYTDIITFNYCENNFISGDIFISIPRVQENSIKYKTQDSEIYRVIIHGVLHLLGYDDKTDAEKTIMRDKEADALNKLNKLK